jgi:hypothetical protein
MKRRARLYPPVLWRLVLNKRGFIGAAGAAGAALGALRRRGYKFAVAVM